MASQFCSKCEITKPIYDFNHDSYATDRYHHKCQKCVVEQVRQWRENNQDYYNANARIRRAINPQLRISNNKHRRLNSVLRRGHYSLRTEQIISLNQPTYLEWLGYNFESEITWANYGKVWQID